MPPPYAIRVKTSTGWQDIALIGPQGPPGAARLTVVDAFPTSGTPVEGDMILLDGVPYFYDGTAWVKFGTGSGGSGAFAFFMGDGD